jgi:hypothetical protein
VIYHHLNPLTFWYSNVACWKIHGLKFKVEAHLVWGFPSRPSWLFNSVQLVSSIGKFYIMHLARYVSHVSHSHSQVYLAVSDDLTVPLEEACDAGDQVPKGENGSDFTRETFFKCGI